ncbi:MAG: hypothetical protein ICCCNLDF_01324 [Planctomycetes bacterium]|nr:hypothetical protein [Planctomycetota bacterium]
MGLELGQVHAAVLVVVPIVDVGLRDLGVVQLAVVVLVEVLERVLGLGRHRLPVRLELGQVDVVALVVVEVIDHALVNFLVIQYSVAVLVQVVEHVLRLGRLGRVGLELGKVDLAVLVVVHVGDHLLRHFGAVQHAVSIQVQVPEYVLGLGLRAGALGRLPVSLELGQVDVVALVVIEVVDHALINFLVVQHAVAVLVQALELGVRVGARLVVGLELGEVYVAAAVVVEVGEHLGVNLGVIELAVVVLVQHLEGVVRVVRQGRLPVRLELREVDLAVLVVVEIGHHLRRHFVAVQHGVAVAVQVVEHVLRGRRRGRRRLAGAGLHGLLRGGAVHLRRLRAVQCSGARDHTQAQGEAPGAKARE